MGIIDKHLHLLESYKNIQSQIKFIDQKAGVYLLICGWMFTSYIKILKDTHIGKIHVAITSISIINLILLLYITYTIIINIISPRIAKNETIGKSTFYYASISEDKTKFLDRVSNLDLEARDTEIANQLYEIAQILDKKTKYLQCISKYLFTSIVLLVVNITIKTLT